MYLRTSSVQLINFKRLNTGNEVFYLASDFTLLLTSYENVVWRCDILQLRRSRIGNCALVRQSHET